MKTAEELLAELELATQDNSLHVTLSVGFEQSSIVLSLHHRTEVLSDGSVVYEEDPNFLPMLKDAIANGGVPIGWYRLRHEKKVVELAPLEDNQHETWAYEYLKHFFEPEDELQMVGFKYYLLYPDGDVLDITHGQQ